MEGNLARRSVRTQTTLYYEDIDNLDVNFEQLAAFGVPGQDNRNAPGNSTINGIEFSLQALSGNTHVDLALAYENSDIGDFPGVIDPIATAANGGSSTCPATAPPTRRNGRRTSGSRTTS